MTETGKKRLDVYIESSLREYIDEMASKDKKHLYAITEELLKEAIARRRGELIETQSLPVIHGIVSRELFKTAAQLRNEIREDMRQEIIHEIREMNKRSDNRLAALLVHAIRNSGIARRLLYTLLAKAYGADFAQRVYEDAKEKMAKELKPQPPETLAEGEE